MKPMASPTQHETQSESKGQVGEVSEVEVEVGKMNE